jgi:hypothetical protein
MLNQVSHVLTEEDIKAVKELFKQADSKLALPTDVPIAGRNRQSMGQASAGYVQDCIEAATAFPTVPSGETDVQKMEEKIASFKVLSDILGVALPITLKLINVRRLMGQDLMADSNSIKENFERAAANRAEMKPTAEKLRQRYARAKKEDDEADKQGEDPKL